MPVSQNMNLRKCQINVAKPRIVYHHQYQCIECSKTSKCEVSRLKIVRKIVVSSFSSYLLATATVSKFWCQGGAVINYRNPPTVTGRSFSSTRTTTSHDCFHPLVLHLCILQFAPTVLHVDISMLRSQILYLTRACVFNGSDTEISCRPGPRGCIPLSQVLTSSILDHL